MKKNFNKKSSRAAVLADKDVRWNLAEFYPALDSTEFQEDMDSLRAMQEEFAENNQGRIINLNGDELAEAISAYDEIQKIAHKMLTYCWLLQSDHVDNYTRTTPAIETIQSILGESSFIEQEISGMTEGSLLRKLSSPALSFYASWISKVRGGGGAMISAGVSDINYDYSTIAQGAWSRIYEETIADMSVAGASGARLRFSDAEIMIHAPDLGVEERAFLREKLAEELKRKAPRLTLVLNTVMQDGLMDAALCGFSHPAEKMLTENGISPETDAAMRAVMLTSFERLSQRLYHVKAASQGSETLSHVRADSEDKEKLSRPYPFDEARKIVLRAFRRFSPAFAQQAEKIFDEKHVDVAPREGKETGGYCMPVVPGIRPYVLLNYTGQATDVPEYLGHEMGHAVHQVLAMKSGSLLLYMVQPHLAETASIFSEMLTMDEIVRGEKNPAVRQSLMLSRVENLINTGVRQYMYHEFECAIYTARKNGELSAEEISDIWQEKQKEYFGPAVELDDYDRYSWMTVGHFFSNPFYVYAYSFAQQLVNVMYHAHGEALAEGPEAARDFVDRWMEFLEKGSRTDLYQALRPFDLDPEEADFWRKGIEMTEKYLDAYVAHKPSAPRAGRAAAPKP